jgi:hypothetical protein
MQTSSASILGLLVLTVTAWAASSVSCASIGSGCIRNSDCSSGQICLASTCQIDPGSIEPQDASGAESASPESSTIADPNDSSRVDADARAPDASVIIPPPDAKSTDVSTDTADATDAADAADAADASDALDSASDTAE